MPIQTVFGDLFENAYQAQAFAHGCNCLGVMGKGIALQFRQRYPSMYANYAWLCLRAARPLQVGDVYFYDASAQNLPSVFNLMTQADLHAHKATYPAIITCLKTMRVEVERRDIRRLALPKIGSGLGGLSWLKVRSIIVEQWQDWQGDLYLYEGFQP